MKLRDSRSILGVDPTKRGLAFVFFEHGDLIDWGTRSASRDPADILIALDELVNVHGADLVVLEDPDAKGCQRRARVRQFLRVAIARLRDRNVAMVIKPRREIRERWKTRGASTKQSVASLLAVEFPELRRLVPPPRKVFMDEDERLQIFDALTLVLAATDQTSEVGR